MSGLTNDMREVRRAAATGDERAALAVEVFGYRLAKHLAGLAVGLGRIDALVFTGGIGEHDGSMRSRTLGHLRFLGFELDAEANVAHGRQSGGRISVDGAGPVALVVPTDEELMIARDAQRLTT
jgi:acetate kinase